MKYLYQSGQTEIFQVAFYLAISIIVYVVFFSDDINYSDQIEKIREEEKRKNPTKSEFVYERNVFMKSGSSTVSKSESCKISASNANSNCPNNATIKTKPEVRWVKPMLFGADHWECTAIYICDE